MSLLTDSLYAIVDVEAADRPLELTFQALNAGCAMVQLRAKQLDDVIGDIVYHADADSAVAIYDRALALAERALGPDDALVGSILIDWGLATGRTPGRDSELMRAALERAIVILRAAPGDNRRELARALRVFAYGTPPEVAVPNMEEALQISRELHGEVHTTIAEALNDLSLTVEPFDPLGADTLMERAVEIQLQLVGERHPTTLSLMNNLAGLRRDRGDYAGAEPIYRRVLEVRREVYPDDDWGIARTQYGLGIVLTELDAAEEAERHLRDARRLHVADLGPDDVLVRLIDVAIARCLAVQGRFQEAETLLLDSYPAVMSGLVLPLDKAKTLQRIVALYEDWGRTDDAARFRTWLHAFTDSTGVKVS